MMGGLCSDGDDERTISLQGLVRIGPALLVLLDLLDLAPVLVAGHDQVGVALGARQAFEDLCWSGSFADTPAGGFRA